MKTFRLGIQSHSRGTFGRDSNLVGYKIWLQLRDGVFWEFRKFCFSLRIANRIDGSERVQKLSVAESRGVKFYQGSRFVARKS
jgi:hypothetical protein